jgi:uncharacterized protein (TIGR03089 family)
MSPVEALRRASREDAARPLVTFYDDRSGERTELSVATTENWVAKTANLLVDDLGAVPGQRLGLALPVHWQGLVWALAGWSVGMVVTAGPLDEPVLSADVLVVDEPRLFAAAHQAGGEVIGCSLHPFGAKLQSAPMGVVDYAAEVLAHGDRFVKAPATSRPVCVVEGEAYDLPALTAAAVEAAAGWGLTSGGRLLTTLDPATRNGLLALAVAPLVLGGSVVAVRHEDPTKAAARRASERVNARAG